MGPLLYFFQHQGLNAFPGSLAGGYDLKDFPRFSPGCELPFIFVMIYGAEAVKEVI